MPPERLGMALDQLKAFLTTMQNDPALKDAVLAASTADDVAKIGHGLGSGERFMALASGFSRLPTCGICAARARMRVE